MKKMITIVALAFIACSAVFTTSCNSDSQRTAGPGLTKTITIDTGFADHVVVTHPCHLYRGGFAKEPQLTRIDEVWSPLTITRNVTLTDDVLAQAGYRYGNGGTVSSSSGWANSQYEEMWVVLCVILLIFLAVGAGIMLYRYATSARREAGTPGFFGTIHTHHHYPVPPRTQPNVPSYTAPNVNTMLQTIKEGLRSGRIIYQNGDELLVVEADAPLEGATDVSIKTPAANP